MASASETHLRFDKEEEDQKRPRREEEDSSRDDGKTVVGKPKRWGSFKLRRFDDDGEQDWWFASTAIPLLAATIAPLANVFSIAALVSYWRTSLKGPDGTTLARLMGNDIPDPTWVYGTNLTSLICGYVGNLALFLNFTNRVPYILALPITIVLWFISTAILTGIQVSMSIYAPPGPDEVYTEAFWYGIIASVLYFLCAVILLVNMLGYFLGHYPQHFLLTEAQRTLILQTFLFFIWLAGGAGVFSAVQEAYGQGENWNFSDAMYFCDVTILTIGFGDLTPNNNVGRGLILPYSVGGIIMLGLMISSISSFAKEMTQANVVQKHVERQRQRTADRSVRTSGEAERIRVTGRSGNVAISSPLNSSLPDSPASEQDPLERKDTGLSGTLRKTGTDLLKAALPGGITPHRPRLRKPSLIVLREEKDRFEAMRKIQHDSANFKRWSALIGSTTGLIMLWFIGAIAFWQIEKSYQGWTYFDGIYFCYVSLLTVGYGDITPKTNAGRPFFVVWSLLAVPSITILISDLADTVIGSFKRWTNAFGDFTLLAKDGIWRDFIKKNSWLYKTVQSRRERKLAEKRIEEGFPIDATGLDAENEHEPSPRRKTLEQLAIQRENKPNEHVLANTLANTIKTVASHCKDEKPRRYTYEEWVEFTDLIRFTRVEDDEREKEDDGDEGLIEWDWIGEDGPIFSKNESEWVLERLCESMGRYVRRVARTSGVGFGKPKRSVTHLHRLEEHGVQTADCEEESRTGTAGDGAAPEAASPKHSLPGDSPHAQQLSDEQLAYRRAQYDVRWHNGLHKVASRHTPSAEEDGSPRTYVGNAFYGAERATDKD